MNINDTVKKSDNALRNLWDYYLSRGRYSDKQAALNEYNRQKNMTGIITKIINRPSMTGKLELFGYGVSWDDETNSELMAYLVKKND